MQRGAARVTAVDVGYGQLDWRLRNDPRVCVMERSTSAASATMRSPKVSNVITIDASFISLRTILTRGVSYLRRNGVVVALVKPQFEAGRERVGSGGVVRDPQTHRHVLAALREAAGPIALVSVGLASLTVVWDRREIGSF